MYRIPRQGELGTPTLPPITRGKDGIITRQGESFATTFNTS
jgi:hypothetical protein